MKLDPLKKLYLEELRDLFIRLAFLVERLLQNKEALTEDGEQKELATASGTLWPQKSKAINSAGEKKEKRK
jgi:hypothetical protein